MLFLHWNVVQEATHMSLWASEWGKGEREREGEIDREAAHREYKKSKCQVCAEGRWIKIVSV